MEAFVEINTKSTLPERSVGMIESFKNHCIPLIVSITLMDHYVAKYKESYLQQ